MQLRLLPKIWIFWAFCQFCLPNFFSSSHLQQFYFFLPRLKCQRNKLECKKNNSDKTLEVSPGFRTAAEACNYIIGKGPSNRSTALDGSTYPDKLRAVRVNDDLYSCLYLEPVLPPTSRWSPILVALIGIQTRPLCSESSVLSLRFNQDPTRPCEALTISAQTSKT